MNKRNSPEKIERLYEENRKLKEQVENLKKENRKLKSEKRTLNSAWSKTEKYLKDVTDGRSVEEIVKNVATTGRLTKFEKNCSKCKSDQINILKYQNFRVVVCAKCAHKEKIDGTESDEQE